MAEMPIQNDASLNGSAPDESMFHSGDRKRKRKALSCFQCRRRKLRCDREYPSCGRCLAQAHPCTYEVGPQDANGAGSAEVKGHSHRKRPDAEATETTNIEDPGSPHPWLAGAQLDPDSASAVDVNAHLVDVISSDTWQKTGHRLTKPPGVAPGFGACFKPGSSAETIYFKGAGFMTQYYGSTNPTSQISNFPELRSFMKEAIMQYSSLPRVQRDVKALQVMWKGEKETALAFRDSNLVDLLLVRDSVDHLCQLYFDTFESTYRVLHAPTFWKEYQILWADPKVARPAFVVTVLLMMASVSCMSTKERPTYIGDSSAAREAAMLWVGASKSWLDRQSQKHSSLSIWQIRCLLLQANLSNTFKKKRTWTSAGNLLRQAMSAGFHRDPSLLGSNISIFEQEMRRRLWATMTELELQVSIDRGMPSASAGIPSDTAAPLNIDDENLREDLQEAPIQKKFDKYTPTSFLQVSRSSFALRVSLTSSLNELGHQLPYEEVLTFDEKINEKLKELPSWKGPGGSHKVSPLLDIPRAILDIQLRQFLLMLHGPYARRAESNARYSLSKMVCFNSASRILDLHSKLVASGNYALSLTRQDVFRSAVLICHYVYVSGVVQNDLSLFKLSHGFFPYIEGALSILEDRITRLGTGYTHYWYVSAASGLLHSKASSGNAAAQKQQIVDKVLKQYYKVLASQEEIPRLKERAPFNGVHKPKALDTAMPTFDELLASQMPQDSNDQFEFYFGDPAAWVFDNLPTFDQPTFDQPAFDQLDLPNLT